MKKTILLLLYLLFSSYFVAQNDERLQGLENDLNEILEATKAPGFAVAIVEGDQVIYAKGFGYRDYENKIPADANTLFAIGSCTKAFTSSILGQLRQEDKLSFDESPLKYIPDLKFYNDEMNNNIIIKDLMSHRTGLSRHDFSWYLFPTYDKNDLVKRLEFQEPFTGVRQAYYYNNFMFLLQGVIAEKLTGKSWEDNIKERFFTPLGMNRSNVSIEEMEKSTNAAIGYELKKDSIINKMKYYKIAGMSPAGSINSSVNDMSKWVMTWIKKGKFNGKDILPENYVIEAMSSQMVTGANLPSEETPDLFLSNYGYGWFLSSYKGHYRVEHGGNIDGFSANTAFYPSDSLGVVVLTNQNGSSVPSMVRNTVADRMLKTNKTNWTEWFLKNKEKAKKAEQETKIKSGSTIVKNTKPSHILQEYTGTYSNPGYGEFTITKSNDSLFANFERIKFYLRHDHYDVFDFFEVTETEIDTSNSGPVRFNFRTNNTGEIASADLNIESTLDHPIEFKHKPSTIEVSTETLKTYVGNYDLNGLEIKVYTKNENTLYLFVAGQPEYELLATDIHKFVFKTLEGFKVEFVESKGKVVNEMILTQPNGTFKVSRK